MRITRILAVATIFAALVCQSLAEIRTTERTARALPGKDVRIGVYVNVQPDCTSGPLPAIRLSEPPANGAVTVRKANVTATNYKQCLAMQVPAFVATYRSKPNFTGVDALELEVKYSSGRTEIQRFQITVGSPPRSQPI